MGWKEKKALVARDFSLAGNKLTFSPKLCRLESVHNRCRAHFANHLLSLRCSGTQAAVSKHVIKRLTSDRYCNNMSCDSDWEQR